VAGCYKGCNSNTHPTGRYAHDNPAPNLLLTLLFAGTTASAADKLAEQFTNPPDGTKPRCYWYWIDGHISREGITHDLEAMRRVGIGEGYIGIIGGGEVKA